MHETNVLECGLPAALGAAVAFDGTDSGREKRVRYSTTFGVCVLVHAWDKCA